MYFETEEEPLPQIGPGRFTRRNRNHLLGLWLEPIRGDRLRGENLNRRDRMELRIHFVDHGSKAARAFTFEV